MEPWSRHLFQYPGHWEREEQAKPESELVERLPDGGERRWAIGEAGAFTQETSGLPGVDVSVQRLGGPDYDDPAFYIEGRTEHAGRAYSFAVTFTYDGQPQPFEVRPYGWRFSSGEIQEVAATPSSPVEYTDVYEMLDAMLVGLYAPDGEGEGR